MTAKMRQFVKSKSLFKKWRKDKPIDFFQWQIQKDNMLLESYLHENHGQIIVMYYPESQDVGFKVFNHLDTIKSYGSIVEEGI